MRSVFSVFIILCQCVSLFGDPPTTKNLQRSAEAEVVFGDFFQAYRVFNALQTQKPEFFADNSLPGYIRTIWVLSSPELFEKECNELSQHQIQKIAVKASYLCGLYTLRENKPDKAAVYLSGVNQKSALYWPSQILLASADMFRNIPEQGLRRLDPKFQKDFEKKGLKSQFFLTRARLLTSLGKWEEASLAYQAIGIRDPYYMEALYETSFVMFKLRRFETVRVLTDVLISNYQSPSDLVRLRVPSSYFYQISYLRGYIELLEIQQEQAQTSFSNLKVEYDKFVKNVRSQLELPSVLMEMKGTSKMWSDVKAIPDQVENQLNHVSNWLGANRRRDLEKLLFYQLALQHESQRVKGQSIKFGGSISSYPAQMEKLLHFNLKLVLKKHQVALTQLSKGLNSLSLKTEMARMEVAWMGRAQGARSVDDILENYRQETQAISELLEE